MDIRFLMKQAQAMQDKLKAAQEIVRAEGTSGGEAVKVTLNGAKELLVISIAKEAMDPEDPSMLEDLLMAAFKDATAKADAEMARHTAGFGGGMNIPGLKF